MQKSKMAFTILLTQTSGPERIRMSDKIITFPESYKNYRKFLETAKVVLKLIFVVLKLIKLVLYLFSS